MFRRRHLRSLGKQLTVITMSYGGTRPPDCAAITRPIFRALAPFLSDPVQLLFIRDNPAGTVDGRIGGGTHSRNETLICVPAWPADRAELTAVVAHELHHLARRQNAGYGETLGGALLSEGFASWFETLMSAWEPAWVRQRVPEAAVRAAVAGWAKPYDHASWFFDGPHGKQAGYALGHALVTRAALGAFDLQTSLTVGPDERYLRALKTIMEEK